MRRALRRWVPTGLALVALLSAASSTFAPDELTAAEALADVEERLQDLAPRLAELENEQRGLREIERTDDLCAALAVHDAPLAELDRALDAAIERARAAGSSPWRLPRDAWGEVTTLREERAALAAELDRRLVADGLALEGIGTVSLPDARSWRRELRARAERATSLLRPRRTALTAERAELERCCGLLEEARVALADRIENAPAEQVEVVTEDVPGGER